MPYKDCGNRDVPGLGIRTADVGGNPVSVVFGYHRMKKGCRWQVFRIEKLRRKQGCRSGRTSPVLGVWWYRNKKGT